MTTPARCARPPSPPTERPATRSSTVAATPARSRPGFTTEGLPQVRIGKPVGSRGASTTWSRNVEEGRLDEWCAWYCEGLRLHGAAALRRRPDLDRVLRAAVDGHVERRGHQAPDQRAGPGPAEEPDPGVPRLLPRPRRPARRPRHHRHRPVASTELKRRGVRFLVPPATYYEHAQVALRRPRPALGRAGETRHPRRRRRRRVPPAGVHGDVDRIDRLCSSR